MILFYLFISILIGSFLYSYFTKNISENKEGFVKTIRRSSLQYKLISWTIGREPVYHGYCPFFWSVWACIALAPATLFIKIFGFVYSIWCGGERVDIGKPWEPIESYKLSAGEKLSNNIHEESIYDWCDDFKDWKSRNPNWKEICLDVYHKQQRLLELRDKKTKAKEKREEQINYYVDKVRWLFKPCLFATAATLAAWILYFIKNILVEIVAATSFMDVFVAFTVIFLLLALVFGVKFLMAKIRKLGQVVDVMESKMGVGKGENFVEGFFSKFWAICTLPFKFIGRLYQKECPIVKMED